ncbi:MAG: hypothetical protein IJ575_02160 [Selenomonadaceae bacterium]|nr:hypothetical protein [Selenomonadaceae bacterium]
MKILHSIEEVEKDLDCIYSEGKRSIEKFHELLSDVGSLWIQISDQDMEYLKIECDPIFGRENFVTL